MQVFLHHWQSDLFAGCTEEEGQNSSHEQICEDPGWLLPLRLAKKGQDGWACPGDVDEVSWEALLPITAVRQLLYLKLRCFAACCC